jgi:DNA-binding MltR family transcriptional regulator
MTQSDDWIDADISALDLDHGEKAGLQVYRNYTRGFEEYRVKQFIDEIDIELLDLRGLDLLHQLIIKEEPRVLPVIVCAFADDILEATFKKVLPEGIPGGKDNLLSGFGPLSDLSKRIKIAYAFDVLSADLMEELDRLRSARNKISHSWDIESLDDFFTKGRLADMQRIEESLAKSADFGEKLVKGFSPIETFRVRLVWIVGRLVYEAAGYNRAKAQGVPPHRALYGGKPAPKWLGDISKKCVAATRAVAANPVETSEPPKRKDL